MSNQSGYKEQQKLSFVQFVTELPDFIALTVFAIFSRSSIVFVDLLDSFGELLRTAMVTLLSRKLSKDLRFEYNYGIGKIEAISSLLCNGIVFLGLFLMLGVSVYNIVFPSKPSDLLIAVVGLKVLDVSLDTVFFIKQRKIIKEHISAIAQTNYASATAALLFDSVTLVSLLTIWLLRNNAIGEYISPIICIIIALCLMHGCVKRTKAALDELTDKTLPEEMQMKILKIMTRFYDRYSQLYAINSHKSGDVVQVDLHMSFEENTTFEEIIGLKKQMQIEFDRQIGNCFVSIIVEGNHNEKEISKK